MALNCLHRGIGRPKAEQLLLEAGKDGSYLVRESETVPGGYTLCLLFECKVHQYRILPDGDQLYIKREGGNERKYVDLLQLVQELEKRGADNGLVVTLKYPVKVQNIEETERDTDDEDDIKKDDGELSASKGEYSGPSDEFVNRLFMQRFRHLDLSSQDGEFVNLLREYVENGIEDDYHATVSGKEDLQRLRQLLGSAIRDLDRQIDFFLSKVGMLKQLFGKATPSPGINRKHSNDQELDLKSGLEHISHIEPAIDSLEKKAVKYMQNLPSQDSAESALREMSPPITGSGTHIMSRPSNSRLIIPACHFEVLGKNNQKLNLTVDIQQGKLFVVRPNKTTLDASNVFLHDKIEQLIKCTKNNCRLEIKLEGRKMEAYVFDNVRKREHFCQVVQQLKNLHSPSEELQQLSLFIGTWNMGFEAPHWNLKSWLRSHGVGKTRPREFDQLPHHLYVIGTQESCLNEKDWVNKIKATLQEIVEEDMHVVSTLTMWNVRLLILVQADYKHKISHVQTSSVKTGIANALGNKGAAGISFHFDGTSFCFINAHLTSGHERNSRRNHNVKDIMKGLSLGPKNLSHFDITTQFHHLFFLGDLNYRLEGIEATEIINKVSQLEKLPENHRDYNSLLFHDQLLRSQQEKDVFCNFREEDITFPPTYRYAKGSKDKYEWQKHKKTGIRINAPSWCDRVLWKSFPETYIENTSYGCVQDLYTSDHKPVFATFDVGVTSQFVSARSKTADNTTESTAKIVFKEIYAEVKTRCKNNFQIEFQSSCIDGPKLSQANVQFKNSGSASTVCPEWIDKQLPILEPIVDDREYLEDQHVLLAVKSTDGMESFGECVLALKSMFSVIVQPFETILVHGGEETGRIKGLMRVEVKGSLLVKRSGRARKSYEFVSTDREELQNFTKPASIGRAISAQPDFAKPVDLEEPDDLEWSSNSIYHSNAKAHKKTLRSHSSSEVSETSMERPDSEAIEENTENNNNQEDEPKPALPSRKPRLGQSSLAQTAVLPIMIATQSMNNNGNRKHSANRRSLPHQTSDSNSPTRNSRHEDNIRTRDINSKRPGSNRHGYSTGSFRGAVCVSLESTEEDDNERLASPPPPVLPPRQHKMEGNTKPQLPQKAKPAQTYAKLSLPRTVSEWLLNLGLPQYTAQFIKNGWDQIQFIFHVSDQDLINMGITQDEHRQRILQSLKDMCAG